MRVVGLMSGTSLDGIDAALVELDAAAGTRGPGRQGMPVLDWRLLAFETFPYSPDRREEIHDAIARGDPPSLTRIHYRLGEWFAEAVLGVCRAAGLALPDLDLIGSHGQTVWHQPPQEGFRGGTLQLGCPATIAERTGVTVVSDFRSRDMAAGGEGAPLVPWVDRALFSVDRPRVLQNIGGMANLTLVPPTGSDAELVAFDNGPGNALIDAAVHLATDGAETYDRDGRWARRGSVDEALLAELLAHPFFRRPPPKSTGREVFGRPFVHALVERSPRSTPAEWADLVATLTALTARTIADSLKRWADPGPGGEVVVTGGGGRNPALMEMLAAELDPIPVRANGELGVPSDAKEAVAFAVLAWAHVRGLPGNVPAATGAAGPRVLGSLTPGRRPLDVL
jgi:anhydro-N-acetylmuramic acid kinase